MLFGYSLCTYVETRNPDVNMAAMDAAFVEVYYGMSVDRSVKIFTLRLACSAL